MSGNHEVDSVDWSEVHARAEANGLMIVTCAGTGSSFEEMREFQAMREAIQDHQVAVVLRLLERGVAPQVAYVEEGIRDDMPRDLMLKEQTILAMSQHPDVARASFYAFETERFRNEALDRRDEARTAAGKHAELADEPEESRSTYELSGCARDVKAAADAAAAAAKAAPVEAERMRKFVHDARAAIAADADDRWKAANLRALEAKLQELEVRVNQAVIEAKDAADEAQALVEKTKPPAPPPPRLPAHMMTPPLPQLTVAYPGSLGNAKGWLWTAPLPDAMRADEEGAREQIKTLAEKQFPNMNGKLYIAIDVSMRLVHVVTGHEKAQCCKITFIKRFAQLCGAMRNKEIVGVYAQKTSQGDADVSADCAFNALKERVCDTSLTKAISTANGVQFTRRQFRLPQKPQPGANFFDTLAHTYLPHLALKANGFRKNTQGTYTNKPPPPKRKRGEAGPSNA